MNHEMSLEVRHYECDVYHHVNNATYLNYLEFARERSLRDNNLDYTAWMSAGNGIFVQEYHLIYHSPALAGESLQVSTRTSDSGGAWVVLAQTIRGPEQRLILEAQVKLVWVGSAGKPTRIPPDWRVVFTRA